MNLHDTLIHAVTEYDRKQSTKKHHNWNALGIYFQRVDDIVADVDRGADVRKAVMAGFSDRLLDHVLRALKLPVSTKNEAINGAWSYQPVSKSGRCQ